MKTPKFEVSLSQRQQQRIESLSKQPRWGGKKRYLVSMYKEDPVSVSVIDQFILDELGYESVKYRQVKWMHPKEAMIEKLSGKNIEEY